MTTVLVTTIYKDSDAKRYMELIQCLCENAHCSEISKIVVLVDDDFKFPVESPKIDYFKLSKRPTFQDAFYYADQYTSCEVKIVSNGDIYFKDEDLKLIKAVTHKDRVVALSRWDVSAAGEKHHAQRDSQDVWIYKNSMRKGYYDFTIGFLGADNRIAHELMSAGYEVVNPSKTIRTYHLHNTGIRTYTRNESYVVPKPYYLITPTYIGEQKYISSHSSKNAAEPNKPQMEHDPIVTDEEGNVVYDGEAQKAAMLELLSKKQYNTRYLLTVAIPTMQSRKIMRQGLIDKLTHQMKKHNLLNTVQVYPFEDNGVMPIGYKRNWINIHCSGKYVIHLDDDDDISDNYLIEIVQAIKSNPNVDAVTFNAQVTYDGENPELMVYDKMYKENKQVTTNNGTQRERMVAHINAIKREHCLAHPFIVIDKKGAKNRKERGDRGSDVAFSEALVRSGVINNSVHIGDVLYYYKYIQNK